MILFETSEVLAEVADEREAQDARWGQQDHPNGTGFRGAAEKAVQARELCQAKAEAGLVTWRHILAEEVSEAFAESDPIALRAELVQVAAVAAAWVEAIDRTVQGPELLRCEYFMSPGPPYYAARCRKMEGHEGQHDYPTVAECYKGFWGAEIDPGLLDVYQRQGLA